jgi:hypothetical protein
MSWPVWSSPRSTAPKSTNPLERLKGEIKRPSEMVGISPTKPPCGSSDAYLSVFAGDSSVRAFAAATNMLALAS